MLGCGPYGACPRVLIDNSIGTLTKPLMDTLLTVI